MISMPIKLLTILRNSKDGESNRDASPSAPGQSSPELNAKRTTLWSRACQVQGPSSYSRARGERDEAASSDRDRGAVDRSTTRAGSRNAARNLSAREASREVPTHRSRSSNNRPPPDRERC